jgi:vacuolar-type H+-ATPase subunit H
MDKELLTLSRIKLAEEEAARSVKGAETKAKRLVEDAQIEAERIKREAKSSVEMLYSTSMATTRSQAALEKRKIIEAANNKIKSLKTIDEKAFVGVITEAFEEEFDL